MRRAIGLVLGCIGLSGCGGIPSMPSFSLPSFNMSRGSPGTPVHVTSIPSGAQVSFGTDAQSCTTPCTLTAQNGPGTYNVSFKLNGYQPQSVPVRIAVNESGSMQSGDSGSAPTPVITPDPVMAELAPFAPAAMKPPAARTKAKHATTTAAISESTPAPSPPPPAPPTLPSPLATTPTPTQPNASH